METDSRAVLRRRVGALLRRSRENAGLTIEDVAAHLECSSAKVSRIENGQVGVRPLEIREILGLYGVPDARRSALLDLVRSSRESKPKWWHEYADVVGPDYEFFVELEDRATLICDYQAFLIPGLLQTEPYMRAVMAAHRVPADVAAQRIRFRQERQSLLRRPGSPAFHAVIEENALRKKIGDGSVMREQLRWLVEAGAHSEVSLQVVPATTGLHPAEGRAFIMLGFPDPEEPKVVYLEHLNGSHLLDTPAGTDAYDRAFADLQAIALSPEDSASFIENMAKE
ncbi:helix-turn-helix transcriptional regulator [Nonomuraea sp. NPDC050202]|jgi:transcriptional regulator with XRE-family HTH domain|uniref:helix-turn-helix domain-containing protein n=1 Tax=Nonomuraea sp. NPDC050202 TaxID=3155035 RepID=UPI0033F13066